MKLSTSRNLFGISLMTLLIVLGASFDAMGQGRGRRASQFDKKCAKFVNCHDARDGRWDGRGPNRRTRYTSRYWRQRRSRDFDNNSRGRHHNRDFDRDRSWRRRR